MHVLGVDEAGRGPLAGPLAVGAVLLPENASWDQFPGLRDSKKLSAHQRERWFTYVCENFPWAVSFVHAPTIDRVGMTVAGTVGVARAVTRILVPRVRIILDYGLHAPHTLQQESFVKGDERFPAIALASIMAKVSRDRLMERYADTYPEYGFSQHKGYGTKKHYEALRSFGMCAIHRRTFVH